MEEQAATPSTSNPDAGPWGMPPAADYRTQRAYWRAQRRAARYADPTYHPGLFFGGLLVLVGGLGLLSATIPNFDAGLVWALAVLALGVLVLARAMAR